jgi:excisionase family DNA binding protein
MSAPNAKAAPVWSLTAEEFWTQLRELVATEVAAAVSQEPAPLLTFEEAAALCKCSTRHLRRLRSQGLPVVMLGESVRFERDTLLNWLRTRPGADVG